MKLQDQCCTVEQAKRLKELGIEQEGHNFYYGKLGVLVYGKGFANYSWCTAAFTVSELGIMLPPGTDWSTNMMAGPGGLYCHVETNNEPYAAWPTEAQGRADLLITLLEDGKITAAEVNGRVTAK